jgi:hypothetical protein
MAEKLTTYDPATALVNAEEIAFFVADAQETGDATYIVKALDVAARAAQAAAEAQPVGREFDAPVGDAATPLERLRDTVQRYDNPTDPVWPLNDKS